MNISDISLLIFDECHHTVKNEPYNQIMRVYLDKRYENQDAKLPQVSISKSFAIAFAIFVIIASKSLNHTYVAFEKLVG